MLLKYLTSIVRNLALSSSMAACCSKILELFHVLRIVDLTIVLSSPTRSTVLNRNAIQRFLS